MGEGVVEMKSSNGTSESRVDASADHSRSIMPEGSVTPPPDEQGDPMRFSLGDFVVGDSDDPLRPPLAFTQWREAGAWQATLYEPEMLAAPGARGSINYEGKAQPIINLCSYNYLGLANHPEIVAAAQDALATYGVGACGSPTLSGMTDLHRLLERKVADRA